MASATLKKPKPIRKTFLISMSPKMFQLLVDRANMYTGGNKSRWIKYAITLRPRKKDLID